MATTPNPNQGTNQSTNQGTTSGTTSAQSQTEVTSALATADTNATQSVANLKLVQQARLSRLTRTAATLTAKYGASDPRAITAQAAVAATTATVGRVSMVHQQLVTPAVPVAAAGWALHGQVLDAQYQPQTKFTVFLVDANKNFLQQYSFSYTDDNGYFLINYAGEPASTPPAQPGTPTAGTSTDDTTTAGATAETTPAPTAPTASTTPTTELYLQVVDADANPVYLSTAAFQPVLGSATYQNIALPAGAQAIGDPPAAIRAVAMPKPDVTAKPATNTTAKTAPTNTTSTTDTPNVPNSTKWWQRNR